MSGDATIQTGEEAQVKLNITHSDTDVTSYAAYSMKVNYNKDVLTYKDKSFSDADATVTDDGNGTLTIRRFGKDLELGKDLTLSFTGKAGGESKVKVSEAKVDKSENALKNAPEATVTGSATITVAQTYKVTLPDNVTGEAIASSNKDYTFTLKNGLDGTYMDVKYKIGEGEEKEPTRNADGSYTIPKDEITGEIVITAVGKTYTVTKEGTGKDDVTLSGATATYGTDYKFTLNGETGYVYDMTVTVGGEKVVPAYDEATKAYTIDGNKITGDIVITVNESKNEAQIIFAGNGAEDVEGGQATRTATPGQNFVFKINKVTGYTYTVTENPEGTYTIAGADIKAGDVITITVEKKAIETKYTIEVNEYVTLDGKAVFLITAKLNKGVTLAEGKVLAYGNNAMFQNADRYGGAYAYLVISDKSLAEVTAEAEADGKITEVEGSAETFNVNGDVNGTGLVDINDAQLVYNIYNTKYDSFDTTTMKMFLAADVNNDKTVSSLDAAAVVASIK